MEITFPPDAIRVLDKGFVRLVDCMGDDSSIVQAARVSYQTGTKTLEADEGLIRYLMRHRHTTPFEMVEFKFHCRMPIFVARQWIRHRTASVNEMSGRYSEMPEMFYEPSPELCTTQSAQNKQGGSGTQIENSADVALTFGEMQAEIYQHYKGYLAMGMRRELARVNLPLAMYTEWYWKIDLHNLLHFLDLRLGSHAQYEIREFALAMAEIVSERVPITWRAFNDYRLCSMSFSGIELRLLGALLNGEELSDELLEDAIPNKRERAEFIKKIEEIRCCEECDSSRVSNACANAI
ncbi:MAG: FAD-dependent thymidylate synthase [Deltaproteobacteria bacterium]|nr:FAD-dependent thymidylate synthase [Deltaproteobacteria bacterium]